MKNATFAFLYGAGDAKFARMAGIEIAGAREFRKTYAQEFPAINEYARRIEIEGDTGGEIETGYLGRKQRVRKKDGSYKLLNYVTQGEAGDVLKKKLVELSMTDVGPHMRLPIHDEILFEVPEDQIPEALGIIQAVMPENDAFSVPLSVGTEVIDNWGEKY
jgi:DNA polymerase-1